MRALKTVLMMVAVLILVSGCAGHNPMTPEAMYMAPNFTNMMPKDITVVRLTLNPTLDVSDTAFYPDFGLPESSSWPFYFCSPEQKGMKEAKELKAIRVSLENGQKVLLVFIPEKLEKIKDYKGFLTDHAGKRIYGPDGQMAYVPDWSMIKPENFEDIILPIGKMNVIEASKGTSRYDDIMSLLKPYQNAAEKSWTIGLKVKDDYLAAYGVPSESMLDPIQAKALTNDQTFKEKMMSLLTEDWYGVITYPLWTPEQYGASVLISKVFQIPTKLWSFDYERPGYMDRKLTAVQGAVMMEYYDENYGFKSYFTPEMVEKMQAATK